MAWLLVLLVVCVGALIPIQAGVNASLRYFLHNPIFAGLTNFLVGGSLIATYAIVSRQTLPTLSQIGKAPWWCFIGGGMGAVLVLSGVFLSHRLGAATFIACIILGQLTSSVIVDHFGLIGFPVHPINGMRLMGLGLLAGGVYLIRTN